MVDSFGNKGTDLKTIITFLSKVEKEAGEIVDNINDKKLKMYKEFEDKMRKIDDKYDKKLRKELDKLNEKCSSAYSKETKNLQKNIDKQIEELEKTFKLNHNQYIESLFNKVIGM